MNQSLQLLVGWTHKYPDIGKQLRFLFFGYLYLAETDTCPPTHPKSTLLPSHHLIARVQSFLGDFRAALQHEKATYSIYHKKVSHCTCTNVGVRWRWTSPLGTKLPPFLLLAVWCWTRANKGELILSAGAHRESCHHAEDGIIVSCVCVMPCIDPLPAYRFLSL